MTIKAGFLLLILLCALQPAPQARAAGPILESQAYWVDKSGQASFDDAKTAPYVAFEGSLTRGFVPFALWVKLRIAGQHSAEKLALIVRPTFIRQIELYDPHPYADGNPQVPVVSGRDAAITPVNHIGLDNGFVIEASKEPRDIFLRITTTTTLVADIDVQSLEKADYESHVSAGLFLIYLAFLLAFLLWSLVNWAVRKDPLYGLFALRLAFSMLHLSVMGGLLRYFFSDTLSAPLRDHIYNLVLVSVIAVTASFDFKLISEFGVPAWLRRVAWSLLCLPMISLVLLLLDHAQAALWFNAIVVSVFVIMNVILVFSAREKDKTPHGRMAIITLRIGFVLMAMAVIAPALIVTSIFQSGVPFINLVFLHALITTVTLSAILTIRAREKDLLAQQYLIQYQIKERELLQESERRVEKERFLSMLVHEIRNPLSVIRLKTAESSSSGKAVHQAVADMARIIERVEQSETLEYTARQSLYGEVNLASMLQEIAAEHPVSSRLGSDAPGEFTLRTDVELLRSIMRNLLDNAWKYSPVASRIYVNMRRKRFNDVEGVELSFINEVNEAGLPDINRLFTKYYRSKGAHRHPGSGLGLFLVASWAKALGGSISYEQIEGAGGNPAVRFILWLPA